MTILSMIALLSAYGFVVLYGLKYDEEKSEFFSVGDSTMLKGLFCIIVVLVHVPQLYQNEIQDVVGSFAYIGVTFFFMTSAYGLRWGIEHKNDYLKFFWRKRLPSLLIPAFLCNLLFSTCNYLSGIHISLLTVFDINSWVKVLLLFYFVFWLVYFVDAKFQLSTNKLQLDMIISIIVVILSIIGMFTSFKITILWPVESVGFAYGIILADFADLFKNYAKRRWRNKLAVLFVLGFSLGLLYIKFKNVPVLGDYILRIVLGIVLLILILHTSISFKFGNKVLGYLGGISYTVYLIHDFVFAYFEKMQLFTNSGIYICSCVIVTLFLASVVSWISNKIIRCIKTKV